MSGATQLLPAALAAHQSGDLDRAMALYETVLREQPNDPNALHLSALVLHARGHSRQALARLDQALAAAPAMADASYNRGRVLLDLGDLERAVEANRRCLALNPDHARAWNNLGNALTSLGQMDDAVAAFDRAIALAPNDPEPLSNASKARVRAGAIVAAISGCHRATQLRPDHASAWFNLGTALVAGGDAAAALPAFDQAVTLAPAEPTYLGSRCFARRYVSDDPATLAEDGALWNDRFGGTARRPRPRAHGGPLRIGYVSPDLRAHSVAWFLEPILRAHDRSVVTVSCYSDVAQPDGVTERLRALSDRWVDARGLDDEALATRIAKDGIDVLVDLAGHSDRNRLPLFARRPAPVQLSYLGFPGSTGLAAIDARISDAHADPEVASEPGPETVLRLPNGFHCYAPPDVPEPTRRPAGAPVTFCSFNALAKLSSMTVETWAALLRRVPTARLLIKARGLDDGELRTAWRDAFTKHGLEADRLDLRGPTSDTADHLALYGEADIALDPFPYNGTTTTCEALWMGVPVVSSRGRTHAGRVGASLLNAVGLSDLLAEDGDGYIAIAAALAADGARRASLRAGLRGRVRASPLLDAEAQTRRLEAVYRAAWERFAAS